MNYFIGIKIEIYTYFFVLCLCFNKEDMRPPKIVISVYTLKTINSIILRKLSDYLSDNVKFSMDTIRKIYYVTESCHATLLVATSNGKIRGFTTYVDNAFDQHKQGHDEVMILKTELVYNGLITPECSREYLETILKFLE